MNAGFHRNRFVAVLLKLLYGLEGVAVRICGGTEDDDGVHAKSGVEVPRVCCMKDGLFFKADPISDENDTKTISKTTERKGQDVSR